MTIPVQPKQGSVNALSAEETSVKPPQTQSVKPPQDNAAMQPQDMSVKPPQGN